MSLKARLKAGEPLLGTIVTMPSPPLTQVLAHSGFDWLMLDLEHGAIDLASLHNMINATNGSPCAPLVRLPHVLPWLAKPVLDAGAFGLVFPMIENREMTENALHSLRYPPAGGRGFGAFYAPTRWSLSTSDYMNRADEELLSVILIEHAEALKNLESILSVTGLDVAMIAPFDLSLSLGLPIEHPETQATVKHLEEQILAHGLTLGGLSLTKEDAQRKIARGYRFVALAYDTFLIEGAARRLLEGLKP